MRLRDWALLVGALLVLVLWTEYAYRRGADAGLYECEYGDAGQTY